MNLLWPKDPLGYQSRDDLADEPSSANGFTPVPEQRRLACHYTKLGRWTYFGQWIPPSIRAEMPWMPVHKTWQMNLLWLMDPPVPRQRCLAYQYTKLGRWTYFGWCTPLYQSTDALNTSTQNLADEPTLANGPPKVAKQRCLHTATDI